MAEADVLAALEAVRDDVRKVGRAVLSARPEARTNTAATDDEWALSLLPTVDSLDRCLRAARTLGADLNKPRRLLWRELPPEPRGEGLADGIALSISALEAALGARGYRLDRPVGVPFDSTRHQAVATETGPAAGEIVRTERSGLWHHERLLREAGVIVSVAREHG